MENLIGILGVQIGMGTDKSENLKKALAYIEEAFSLYHKIDLIVLPELFYSGLYGGTPAEIGEELDSEFVHAFSACARNHKVNIITGSFPLKSGDKLRNTCLCINREGVITGAYAKAHLFDAFNSRESDSYDAGSELGIFDFDFGRVGLAICYELRFPEYLRTLALKEIDLLVVPSAFFKPRQDQWTTLVTGTALGNVLYTVAVNQYGRTNFGRSMIVDPLGTIISQASDCEGTVYGLVSLEYQRLCRNSLMTYQNRRPDLYNHEN